MKPRKVEPKIKSGHYIKLGCYSLNGWTTIGVKKGFHDWAQRTVVSESLSTWGLVMSGISQESVLGPVLLLSLPLIWRRHQSVFSSSL